MFRNVSLVSKVRDGQQSWRLLDASGGVIFGFEVFAKSINRSPLNTRKNYCHHLAQFFDYLFEAGAQLAKENPNFIFSRQVLSDILEGYHYYLTEGDVSGNQVARLVSKTLPPTRFNGRLNSVGTSATKQAALRKFLLLSDKIRIQQQELAEHGYDVPISDAIPIVQGLGERRPLTVNEKRSLIGRAMLAGVIARGPQFIAERVLPTKFNSIRYDARRAFPIEKVTELIESFRTYRDKAIYAFLAASGARISEAMQLLWEDIDVTKGEVRLVDPRLRPNHKSYLYLTPQQREYLAWKARDTPDTFLIEPFKTLFFESLALYHAEEYIPHGRHQFVFQYQCCGVDGEPYLLAGNDSYNDVFQGAQRRVGVVLPTKTGAHSLRHTYGTYLLNYIPNPNGGYGYPIEIVSKYMGHASIASTEKYAVRDKEVLELQLQYANSLVFQGNSTKSFVQMRREQLFNELKKLEQLDKKMGM